MQVRLLSRPLILYLLYLFQERYSLIGKTMVSKIIIVGSSPTTFVLNSCSLIGLECHIANVKISVQFRSRGKDEWQSGYCGDLLSLGFYSSWVQIPPRPRVYDFIKRYSLIGKTMVFKIIIVGSSPTTFVCTYSLVV
jgi:hypothetical protein